jgi:hypothetical protein
MVISNKDPSSFKSVCQGEDGRSAYQLWCRSTWIYLP